MQVFSDWRAARASDPPAPLLLHSLFIPFSLSSPLYLLFSGLSSSTMLSIPLISPPQLSPLFLLSSSLSSSTDVFFSSFPLFSSPLLFSSLLSSLLFSSLLQSSSPPLLSSLLFSTPLISSLLLPLLSSPLHSSPLFFSSLLPLLSYLSDEGLPDCKQQP